MKVCPKCKQELADECFTQRKRRNGALHLQAYCKICEKTYKRDYYLQHHEKYKAKARQNSAQYKERMRQFLLDFFAEHSCVDCDETDPVVLEFNHRPDEVKVECVTTMIWNRKPFDLIEIEIAKCDVRCANCHKRKTSKDRNWFYESL